MPWVEDKGSLLLPRIRRFLVRSGLTCAEQAGGGGSLGRLDVASTQRVAHLHAGGRAEPQGYL